MLSVNWSLSMHFFCFEEILRLSFTAYPAGIDNNENGMKATKTLSNYQRILDILQGDPSNFSAYVFIKVRMSKDFLICFAKSNFIRRLNFH